MFVVVWKSNRFGCVVAGSKHDWENSLFAEGVLRFEHEQEARTFVRESIYEKPVKVFSERVWVAGEDCFGKFVEIHSDGPQIKMESDGVVVSAAFEQVYNDKPVNS